MVQGRSPPSLSASNAVKGKYEIGDLGEDGAGNDLMLGHHREFSWHRRHPGILKRTVEAREKLRLGLQFFPLNLLAEQISLGKPPNPTDQSKNFLF
jgi:hypothetical protein